MNLRIRGLLACAGLGCALLLAPARGRAEDQTFSKCALAAVEKLDEIPVEVTISDSAISIRNRTKHPGRIQVVARKPDPPVDIQIPYAAIGRLSYAPLDRRRVASGAPGLLLTGVAGLAAGMTMTQTHWLVIERTPGDPSGVTLLRLDKTEYRTVIAVLDAKSGKHVEVLGPGATFVDPTIGSHDEDRTFPFPVDQVRKALKEGMEAVACRIEKDKPAEIECHRPLVRGRTGWGGEYVAAMIQENGPETRVRIHTERGLGRDWSSAVYREMLKRMQPPAAASKD
ncbi:MAG TPA: hypothetical protein VKX45_05880 [Bryobacteraceae bacterium]|jgi:hypothetical protein|nr:hypothetical protein [Bryobacteraceae bacterium]